MYKFGKTPPRSLKSFGVAGLLETGCHIFYESLYSPKQVGKVSDLLAARLIEAGVDELALRSILMYIVYECYRPQVADGKSELNSGKKLNEPLVVECGIDSEKLAIGLSFTVPDSIKLDAATLEKRIKSGKPASSFEALMMDLKNISDRFVVRFQPGLKRLEFVSLLAVPHWPEGRKATDDERVYVQIFHQDPETTPQAGVYEELGDLNYADLLKEDPMKFTKKETPLSELLVKAKSPAQEAAEKTIVKGGDPTPEQVATAIAPFEKVLLDEDTALADALDSRGQAKTVVKGAASVEGEASVTVKGAPPEADDDFKTVVKGDAQDLGANQEKRVISGQGEEATAGGSTEAQAQLYRNQIMALNQRIATLEEELASAETRVAPSAPEGKPEGGFLKKLWPFKKRKEEPTEAVATSGPTVVATTDDGAATSPEVAELTAAAEATLPPVAEAPETPVSPDSDPKLLAKHLMTELDQGEVSRKLTAAQKEVEDLKRELQSPKAKKWVDGLVADVVAERSQLKEMAKKVSLSVRQKELEFKNRERSLQEELRRRDELIKQKTNALMRAKDQLTQTTMSLERAKSSAQGAGTEAHFQKKFNFTKQQLTAAMEENKNLKSKIEELKESAGDARNQGPTHEQYAMLQDQVTQTEKKIEQSKKRNSYLMEKLTEAEKKNAQNVGKSKDLSNKLDAAMRIAVDKKREVERLQGSLSQSELEVVKLRRKVNELQSSPPPRDSDGGKPSGDSEPSSAA
ncbi:MAG: hypothetical protein AB7P04_02320 [Bacteriovoracia bacterium]